VSFLPARKKHQDIRPTLPSRIPDRGPAADRGQDSPREALAGPSRQRRWHPAGTFGNDVLGTPDAEQRRSSSAPVMPRFTTHRNWPIGSTATDVRPVPAVKGDPEVGISAPVVPSTMNPRSYGLSVVFLLSGTKCHAALSAESCPFTVLRLAPGTLHAGPLVFGGGFTARVVLTGGGVASRKPKVPTALPPTRCLESRGVPWPVERAPTVLNEVGREFWRSTALPIVGIAVGRCRDRRELRDK